VENLKWQICGECQYECVCKLRCAALRIKKALGIFTEMITMTTKRTTRVAFWDPFSGSKNAKKLTTKQTNWPQGKKDMQKHKEPRTQKLNLHQQALVHL